jgi:hypothetical protein
VLYDTMVSYLRTLDRVSAGLCRTPYSARFSSFIFVIPNIGAKTTRDGRVKGT